MVSMYLWQYHQCSGIEHHTISTAHYPKDRLELVVNVNYHRLFLLLKGYPRELAGYGIGLSHHRLALQGAILIYVWLKVREEVNVT